MRRVTSVFATATLALTLAAPIAATAPTPQVFSDPSPRIVGGSEVSPVGKYPFAVAMATTGDVQFCGGALIAPTWVVSAAHCFTNNAGVQNKFPAGVKAIIGRHDLTIATGVEHAVTDIVIHPDWGTADNAANFFNDIALVQLTVASAEDPVELAEEADGALWDDSLNTDEDLGTVMGWGSLVTGGPGSSTLQEVDLPFQSVGECITDWGDSPFFYTAEDVCAGAAGLDSCTGDSGGPLVAPPGASDWKLVGLVSFGGATCGDAHPIPVYTRVSAYLGWIASVTALPVNNDPTADDGIISVPNNEPRTITLTGSDFDGHPLAFSITAPPTQGSLGAVTPVSATSATVVYTPDLGYIGADSFDFMVDDGNSGTDVGTISITVTRPTDTVGLVDIDQGKWYLRNSVGAVTSFFYGNPDDLPISGDWDGDGDSTPGLYRQSDGFFYARDFNSEGIATNSCFAGDPNDVPLAGDWDGDGDDNLGLYRPSEQTFYLFTITCTGADMGAAQITMGFGDPGDKPVSGDWDGDGKDEIGLHRESTGLVYWRNTVDTGVADGTIIWGDPLDRIIAGDWGLVDGFGTPAVFRPSDLTYYFRHTLTEGVADSQFTWVGAESDWLPVSGAFGLG